MTSPFKNHDVQENVNDMTLFNSPKGFLQLISVADIETTSDAFIVFLHSCALNIGFLPKDVKEGDIYSCMPSGWKVTGAWKFKYCHKSCPELFCYMTCVPLYSYIAVHGSIDNHGSQNSIYLKLKTTDYITEHNEPEGVENLFKNTRNLERKFKDRFCFTLLAELQKTAGCSPTFGFCAAVDEVKMYIMQLLPVESVVVMSSVNKDCNRVANFPLLWKHLLNRDFGLVDVDDQIASGFDYKQIYKNEYKRILRRPRIPLPFAPNLFEDPFLFPPTGFIDTRRNLDPAIQRAFPNLRDRFRPYGIFNNRYGYGWFT